MHRPTEPLAPLQPTGAQQPQPLMRAGPLGERKGPNNVGPPGPFHSAPGSAPEMRGPLDMRGPPDIRGPPDGRGPGDMRGPSDMRGPQDMRGPSDMRGPPDVRGPPDMRGPGMKSNFINRVLKQMWL